MTSATPQLILVFSGRYNIMSNASIVNNCILSNTGLRIQELVNNLKMKIREIKIVQKFLNLQYFANLMKGYKAVSLAQETEALYQFN